MENAKVGWIGLGKMGTPMAKNLLANNIELVVYNRTQNKCRELTGLGAEEASSIAELSASCNIIFSMIHDDKALYQVALGSDGVLENASKQTTYIDMSTVSPEASALIAKTADGLQVNYLRAPVSGSTVVAASGLLTVFVSGPEHIYNSCYDLFNVMGRSLFHVGSGEEARYLKLAINMMVGITAAMIGEALTFGQRGGMNWEQMIDIIDASTIASPLIKYKAEALKDRDFAPAFTASQIGNDFDLALETARQLNVPLPLTSHIRQHWSAMKAQGNGELDIFAYVILLESLAGIQSNYKG